MIDRYSVLILAFVSLLLLGLSDNIRGPLFPEILQTFQVNDGQGSLFFSISVLAGIFGASTAAKWVGRFGEIRTLQLAIFGLGLAQILISLVPQFTVLLLTKVLFGFSLALMGVMQNILVIQNSPEKYRSRILSALHSMYAAASLLAPLLITYYLSISSQQGNQDMWRDIFQMTGMFSFLVVGLSLLQKKWIVQSTSDVVEQEAQVRVKQESKNLIYLKFYFAFILGLYVAAEILIASRLSLFLRREFSATTAEGSWYTAGFFVFLLLGRIIFSFFKPAIQIRHQLVLSSVLSFICFTLGIVSHPGFLVLTGLAMAPFYPLMMSWAGEILPQDLPSAVGLGVSFSNIALLAMHTLVGLFAVWPGIKVAFGLGPLLMIIAMGMLLAYQKIFHRL